MVATPRRARQLARISRNEISQQRPALRPHRLEAADHRLGLAAILNATTPLFTLLVAGLVLFGDERPGALKLLGVAIGLAG